MLCDVDGIHNIETDEAVGVVLVCLLHDSLHVARVVSPALGVIRVAIGVS
jgi:hypothetical protein